jgi:hypothetical protein
LKGWLTDPRFCDHDGTPAPLLMNGPRGASFERLVREYSGDVPPRAMYEELRRAKWITGRDQSSGDRVAMSRLGRTIAQRTE